MAWRYTQMGQEIAPPGGADATVWRWDLTNDEATERRIVLVQISGTAMQSEGVSDRVKQARKTHGETEVQSILTWAEPPDVIRFHSASTRPELQGGDPGPEATELGELVEWFAARGVWLFFTGGSRLSESGAVIYQQWTANLHRGGQGLLHRATGGSRLEAAREAKRWWEQHAQTAAAEIQPSPASASSSASLEISVPAPSDSASDEETTAYREGMQRLKQSHYTLIWTAPTEGDPESMWMVQVVDERGVQRDLAVAPAADDALLTVLENLLPEES